jgi:predicted secreted protein
MGVATLVSAVVFGIFYWLVDAGYLSLTPSP